MIKRYFKLLLFIAVIEIIIFTFTPSLKNVDYEIIEVKVFPSVEHSQNYCVVYNYWESNKEYSEGPHVTLLLHATSNYLFYLEEQLKTWTGGISVSVFIPTPVDQQTDIAIILENQLHLKSVFSTLSSPQLMELKMSGQISLHLFFKKKDFHHCPQLAVPENMYSLVGASLSDMRDFEQLMEIYPINVARNIARKGSKTPLFISGDIEQFYVQGFESRIYQLAKKVLLEEKRETVLVHRRFEMNDSFPTPNNKYELKKLFYEKKVVEFHRFYYAVGHRIRNLAKWLKAPEDNNKISIVDEILYRNKNWEPQFVGDERVPFHDERFPYRYKTNAQLGLHLCFMNYTFSIVSDLFSIHRGIVKMKLIYLILLLCVEAVYCKKEVVETDPLYESWKEFTDLQGNQSVDFNKDFPLDDRLYSNLKKCGHFEIPGSRMTDNIQPSDLKIYAEIGHLLTFCRVDLILPRNPNETLELHEAVQYFKKNCLQSTQTKTKNPTLPKILDYLGADLQVVESNVQHKNLQAWTRHIIHLIERIEGYQDKWKLIVIGPGLFDLKPGIHTHHLAHSVLQSIQLINYKLPEKTIVVVIRNSKQTFWKPLSQNFAFCEKVHNFWTTHEGKSEEVWNVLEERLKKNYCTEVFCVHVMPFLEEAKPIKTGRTLDVSPMSPDCIHFSSRGLSLLHVHLWNWFVQPAKQVPWVPLVRPLYCPRPGCPYFVTKTNTYFCPQTKRIDPQEESKDLTDFLILSMLLTTIVLYALLLVYMACA